MALGVLFPDRETQDHRGCGDCPGHCRKRPRTEEARRDNRGPRRQRRRRRHRPRGQPRARPDQGRLRAVRGQAAADDHELLRVARRRPRAGRPVSIKTDLARVQQGCTNDLQMGRSGRIMMKVAYDDCIGTVQQQTGEISMSSKRMLAAIKVTLATLNSGVEAKKVLVVAGARLPTKSGAELYQWANQHFSPYLTGFNRPTEQPREDAQEELIQDVARLANSDGVTMYLLHAPFSTDPNAIQNNQPAS